MMKCPRCRNGLGLKRGPWARRRGFTLAELLASMTVMGILMLGLGSAIVIASKAVPGAERDSTKLIQESRFAQQISIELKEAVHITERTEQAITFTVADRDDDGSPEHIRYAWSGTAGDPLTRQYNGGSEANVLENTHVFALAYDVKSVTERYPGPPITSSEMILTQNASLGDSDFVIQEQDWIGQYFDPDTFLPAEAVSWSITKVEFVARIEGPPSSRPLHPSL